MIIECFQLFRYAISLGNFINRHNTQAHYGRHQKWGYILLPEKDQSAKSMTPLTEPDSTALAAGSLCMKCGICCDGTLFSRVTLGADEMAKIGAKGIPLEQYRDKKTIFKQPCPRLADNCCTIYADRPRVCRSYYCKLQRDVMNGTTKVADAEKIVAAVKKQTAWFCENLLSKKQRESKTNGYRSLVMEYREKAEDLKAKGLLTRHDQARILRVFDTIKLLDRFFEKTSNLQKYARLIQSFSEQPAVKDGRDKDLPTP